MGCNSSVHVVNEVEAPIVINNCECLAGKFNRVIVPKDIWLSRMSKFITEHIRQFKHYGVHDIDIIYRKLHTYEVNTQNSKEDTTNKHSQAVKVVSGMLRNIPAPSPKQMREELTTMAVDYAMNDKEHEFEEIMFVFSIIINAPMIQFYETKY